jgi:uncharacterized protein (TIGR03437 family)
MSNGTQEFSMFKQIADKDPDKNPKLVIVDGAQGGWTADRIVTQGDQYWATVTQRLTNAGVTAAQVQAGWVKEALAGPTWAFPEDAQRLQNWTKELVHILRARFPNLKLLYLSSRIYAGYASSNLNPEPYAYQSGFAMKWLIEEQINGVPELSFSAGQAPWLSWGPYLWGDGMRQRDDGLSWACADLSNDGTHPSNSGQQKVARMLLDFLKADPTSHPWFVRPPAQQPPTPAPAAVVSAPDYTDRLVPGSIASIYGAELSGGTTPAAGSRPLPTALSGTVVRVGGEPASLYYVSPSQINFVLPKALAGEDLVVVREGIESQPRKLSTVFVAPAIFTLDGWPNGPAAALHSDGRVVTPQAPAIPGETYTVFLTGLTVRNPAILAPVVLPAVTAGGVAAEVIQTGPVDGSPGLSRIEFKLAPQTPPGNASLVVQSGSATSNPATLAISGT